MTAYGLEYFCFEGDGLWTSTRRGADRAGGRRSSTQLGLATPERRHRWLRRAAAQGLSGLRRRLRRSTSRPFRSELEQHYPDLHLVGRNGMHKYNNQDHAMMTAMLTAENILAGDRCTISGA